VSIHNLSSLSAGQTITPTQTLVLWALLIEGMIFSEKGRGAPFLRKNHPWILQPRFVMYSPSLIRGSPWKQYSEISTTSIGSIFG
jgi:hypothetical protein